jgi:hypothetical protein
VGDRRDAYTSFCGRPEGKTPLGRPSVRWQDNLKTDLQQVDGEARMELKRLRIETDGEFIFECCNEISGSMKCGELLY